MNFGKTKLYIDDDSDDFGTTIISNTLLGATIVYNANLIDKSPADGNLYYSFVETPAPEMIATVTFEHDGNAVAEKADWRAENPRLIRFINEGTALTTAGTYTYRTLIVDMAGKWLSFGKIGERNGNDILEGTFHMRYNAAKATGGKIIVVNEVATLAT